jgi:L-lysine 2,3-aminomutase
MASTPRVDRADPADRTIASTVTPADIDAMMDRYGFTPETRQIIATENLLPPGLLSRLHATYPQHSGLLERGRMMFGERDHYAGLDGFREVAAILARHGIQLGDMTERELFVEVYRFKASRHALNSINWTDYVHDSMFQLMFPQPGMMRKDLLERYAAESSPAARSRIASEYVHQTNPHDGHQLLNKPWIDQEDGGIDVVEGSQHKYPQCQLVFDRTTQECFAFCTYCFRHAQVRGDHDMFVQEDVAQIHDYLRAHPEVTDLLITGGDAGYMPVERLRQYVTPILEDPRLLHVRTIRLGTRMLTYEPERILTRHYDRMLALFDQLHDNGVQLAWMAHFSTPRELLNPGTIAAVRRLQRHGVVVRSQSPIMNHISLFTDENGRVDVQRSAQNWIDLANVLATLLIRFHSMYCARATGEHHYFTVPLADIDRIANLVYRSVSSLNRPSRYITMTTSAGKLSILGTAEIGGRKAFALKFNESRNMEWMDRVFLAQYDDKTNRVDFLTPFDTKEFFFEQELREIEQRLIEVHQRSGARA